MSVTKDPEEPEVLHAARQAEIAEKARTLKEEHRLYHTCNSCGSNDSILWHSYVVKSVE